MTDTVFLDRTHILAIHRRCLQATGGDDGLRDQHGLESAIHQPQATFGGAYLHPDLFAQGAAYLFHLLKNHPFVDGNKRVGTVAALVFLRLNGITVQVEEETFTAFVFGVVTGQHDKAAIAQFLQEHSAPL